MKQEGDVLTVTLDEPYADRLHFTAQTHAHLTPQFYRPYALPGAVN